MFHRSPCSTDRLFLAFLLLPSLSKPLSAVSAVSGSDEVIYWYYQIHMVAAGMRERWPIKQKAIDFSIMPPLPISLCSFSTILWGMLAKPKKPCDAQHGIGS
jgi:hypothetical protein